MWPAAHRKAQNGKPKKRGLLLRKPSQHIKVLVHPSPQNIQVIKIGQNERTGRSRRLRRMLDPSQKLVIVQNEIHGVKARDAVLNLRNVEMTSPRFLLHKAIIYKYL